MGKAPGRELVAASLFLCVHRQELEALALKCSEWLKRTDRSGRKISGAKTWNSELWARAHEPSASKFQGSWA